MSNPTVLSLTKKDVQENIIYPSNWIKKKLGNTSTLAIDNLIQLPVLAKIDGKLFCVSGYDSVVTQLTSKGNEAAYYLQVECDTEKAIQILEAYLRSKGEHYIRNYKEIRNELDLYTSQEKENKQFIESFLKAGNYFIERLNNSDAKFKRIIKEENIISCYIDTQLKEILDEYYVPKKSQGQMLGEYLKAFFDMLKKYDFSISPKIGYVRYAFIIYQAFIQVATTEEKSLDSTLINQYLEDIFTYYIVPDRDKWLKATSKNEYVIFALARRHKKEFIENHLANKRVFNPFLVTN